MATTDNKIFVMFLQKALEKILSDREIRKNYNSEIKEECERKLKTLKDVSKASKSKDGSHHLPEAGVILADDYFKPFQLACQSRSPRIVSTALDCLQKLIAYGQLTGASPDPENPNKKLIDTVIETICDAFHGVNTDPDVELQIIKALLTAVTSQTCEIHEMALLTAIRCCYNINLFTKNTVNSATAKATLTQMLSVCFSLMEYNSAHLLKKSAPEIVKTSAEGTVSKEATTVNGHPDDSSSVQSREVDKTASTPKNKSGSQDQTSRNNDNVVQDAAPAANSTEKGSENAGGSVSLSGDEDVFTISRSLVDGIIEAAVREVESEEGMLKADDSMFNITQPGEETQSERSDTNCGESVQSETNCGESLRSEKLDDGQSEPSEKADRSTEKDDRGSTSEPVENEQRNENNLKNTTQKKSVKFDNVYMRDAYLVLRTLCKMTMQPMPEGPIDPRSHEMRSKMLALQLLLSVMQNHAGPVMKSHKTFAQLIKQFLCVALSKNGVSTDPSVFEISLSIFLILISNFKYHLKMQIEVFFKDIFLSVLENPSYSFQHKWFVMRALAKVCADPQIIVDIYLNYDCDMVLDNIFERLVNDISRIAQGNLADHGLTPQQEAQLQHKGMECLVSILKCLVEWSKDMYRRPQQRLDETTEKDGESKDTLEEKLLDTPGNDTPRSIPRSTSMSSLASAGLLDNPQEFENIKKQKSILEQGIEKFNKKPKKGIEFLQDAGLIGPTSADVARFFHTDERLSKTMIGEILGDDSEECKKIMSDYVDQLDFNDMAIVTALRTFLAGFRLPGEAQKIDRLMLKFAQRYYENNPELEMFASADTCYVLAYSIIMLTTDLHNDQVRNKITKPDYIKMNRGINDSQDLPPEYLEGIYDEISANEIKMRYDKGELTRVNAARGANESQKRQLYKEAMTDLSKNALVMMEGVSKKDTVFTSASHSEHVRPMLMLTWTPFLAVFSITLQDCNDAELIAQCLAGFKCAVRVACIFKASLVRSAYIQSLARFTMLNVSSGFSEIKPKNLEAIKTLITIAFNDCNYLEESWYDILKVISQLELAQLIGTGVKTKFLEKETMMDKKLVSSLQQTLGTSANQNVIVAVDRIFTGSDRLDGSAIVYFTDALCKISCEELNNPVAHRMFSLQKIVEISYYNMGRIRIEWSKIWHVIGDHFNKVGCSPNEEIAAFAVDSLRQLSMKFLEKGELPNFRFQKDFLRPFETIMKNNENNLIRDMVVRCIAQMVNSQARNIRSGWNNIFSVFHMAAADRDQAIVELAFQTTASIFEQYFSVIGDSFQDAVKCLSEFACNAAFPDTSMEAIRYIRRCANYVTENPEQFAGDENNQENVWVKGWFPVLFELSCIISRCKLDVRTRALTVMFEIMKHHGKDYKVAWWKDLFKIVFRIFDHMKLTDLTPEQYRIQRKEWMTTTCNHALYAVVDVFTQHFSILSELLVELLNLIQWCVKQDNEQLAKSGMNCLENLVMGAGHSFKEADWDLIIDTITEVYAQTLPADMRIWKPTLDSSFDQVSLHSDTSMEPDNTQLAVSRADKNLFQHLDICCVVQTEIVQTIDNIIFFPASSAKEDARIDPYYISEESATPPPEGMFNFLTTKQLFRVVECLFESHKFSKGFNMDIDQRKILWKYGFKGKTIPDLQAQETSSLLCSLRILHKIYSDMTRVDEWPKTEIYLHRLTVESFEYYTMLEEDKRRLSWGKIVILMLKKMMLLDDERFVVLLAKCYNQICHILAQDNERDLQIVLSKFFLRARDPLFKASS
ncbi:hypothetical protein ACHWQZ_G017457 [Mnemiopsis leidyi]